MLLLVEFTLGIKEGVSRGRERKNDTKRNFLFHGLPFANVFNMANKMQIKLTPPSSSVNRLKLR